MVEGFLYQAPLWAVFVTLLIGLPLSAYAGYLIGHFFYRKKIAGHEISTFVPTTVLGLLALILGFTFSMSVTRYEYRKDVVMKEANAIGSAILRADTLVEPYRTKIKTLLSQYVHVRVEFLNAAVDVARVNAAQAETTRLQTQIMAVVNEMVAKNRDVLTAQFVASMDTVISLESERLYAIEDTVPALVFYLILFIASIGLGSMGFIRGVAEKKSPWSGSGVLILTVLFAMVIVLIEDLDRPRRGMITVTQEGFLRLEANLSPK